MADSAEKRAADTKSLADKESQKGDLEAELVTLGDEHKATVKIDGHGEVHWQPAW
jgi:hypothetical protein